MRRHLSLTKRIRALDPHRDSAEFAEGRLVDYSEQIMELIRLRDDAPEDIATLQGLISVSMKLLVLKRQQFNLPVVHGSETSDEDDLDTGGTGIPAPISFGPWLLSGSSGRLFSESAEWNDW
jgi:hypothetical protein